MPKIVKKTKPKIAICGLGYVGLPVALLFAKAGFEVIGVDVDDEKVDKINRGQVTIIGKEPGLKELTLDVHKKGNFYATTDSSEYKKADVILVAVETPVEDDTHEPVYAALTSALKDVGQNMKKGILVIIESTIAPQTMEKIVRPILEQESGLSVNTGFLLANCPERLMPGRLLENIQNYNRVVGGFSKKASAYAKDLYKNIVHGELEETDCLTAEIVKAGENAYRDVQIAFANELALLCEALGANVWEARRLINECRRRGETKTDALRHVHFPGAGVGGHCIPKDSWLLVYGVKDLIEPQIIPLARKINNFMPKHMFFLLKSAFSMAGKTMDDSKIAVLGFAYTQNSDDTRNTPAIPFLEILEKTGADIVVQDPYIKKYKTPLEAALRGAQAMVIMASHDQYKKINLGRLKKLMLKKPIIIDGRNCIDKEKAKKAGFIYKGIGNI